MVSLTQDDNEESATLKVGETLTITLPENATTGYRWAFDDYDAELLEPGPPQSSYTGGVGAAGTVRFSLIGRKAGQTDVALKYWRHWEGDASVIDRFRIHVLITD